MELRKHFLLALALAIFSIKGLGQDSTLVVISGDTAIAGQVNVLKFADPGIPGGALLDAFMRPIDRISNSICRECNEVILYATDVVTDGSVVTATFDIPLGTYPINYDVRLGTDPASGWIGWHADIQIVSEPYIYEALENATVCYRGETLFEIKAYEPDNLQYQWYHNTSLLDDQTGSSLFLEVVEPDDTGRYSCVVSNLWGTDTASVHLNLHPYRDSMGMPVGPNQLCMGGGTYFYGPPLFYGLEQYTWRLEPTEAGSIQPLDYMANVSYNPEFAGVVNLFTEIKWGECAGPNSDTLKVLLVGPTIEPEICIVGIDQDSEKYRIVWNKLEDQSISSYHILRESNQANVFLEVGTVSSDEPGVFVDSSSSPEVLSHSYRLSYTDTCGNVSDPGAVHSTVHLTASLGTGGENHLNWSPYLGFAFLTYKIYRGTSKEELELWQEVSSNVTLYTDQDPPAQVFYQVVVSKEGECQPFAETGADFSLARSNVYELNTIGIGETTLSNELYVYPNPAKHSITVSFPGLPQSGGSISIYDLSGSQVAYFEIHDKTTNLPVAHLKGDIYFIRLDTRTFSIYKKLVLQ